VQGALLHEGVEFDFFKAAWGADAFLVTGGDVTRGGHASGFGFRAFEGDDIARHKMRGVRIA